MRALTIALCLLASAIVPRRNKTQHLANSQRATTQKRRVSRPLQARWAAFFVWGDKMGDKHPLGDVSCPLARRCRVALHNLRPAALRPLTELCYPMRSPRFLRLIATAPNVVSPCEFVTPPQGHSQRDHEIGVSTASQIGIPLDGFGIEGL